MALISEYLTNAKLSTLLEWATPKHYQPFHSKCNMKQMHCTLFFSLKSIITMHYI